MTESRETGDGFFRKPFFHIARTGRRILVLQALILAAGLAGCGGRTAGPAEQDASAQASEGSPAGTLAEAPGDSDVSEETKIQPLFWYKDNGLFLYQPEQKKSIQVTVLRSSGMDPMTQYYSDKNIADYAEISEDGRSAFYLKDITTSYFMETRGKLCAAPLVDIGAGTGEQVIAEQASSFHLLPDGSLVYLDGNGSLFYIRAAASYIGRSGPQLGTLPEPDLLMPGVKDYRVSDDGDAVFCTTMAGSGYMLYPDKEDDRRRVAQQAEDVLFASGDLNRIYIRHEDDLYCVMDRKESKVVDVGVKDLLIIKSTGNAYYLREDHGTTAAAETYRGREGADEELRNLLNDFTDPQAVLNSDATDEEKLDYLNRYLEYMAGAGGDAGDAAGTGAEAEKAGSETAGKTAETGAGTETKAESVTETGTEAAGSVTETPAESSAETAPADQSATSRDRNGKTDGKKDAQTAEETPASPEEEGTVIPAEALPGPAAEEEARQEAEESEGPAGSENLKGTEPENGGGNEGAVTGEAPDSESAEDESSGDGTDGEEDGSGQTTVFGVLGYFDGETHGNLLQNVSYLARTQADDMDMDRLLVFSGEKDSRIWLMVEDTALDTGMTMKDEDLIDITLDTAEDAVYYVRQKPDEIGKGDKGTLCRMRYTKGGFSSEERLWTAARATAARNGRVYSAIFPGGLAGNPESTVSVDGVPAADRVRSFFWDQEGNRGEIHFYRKVFEDTYITAGEFDQWDSKTNTLRPVLYNVREYHGFSDGSFTFLTDYDEEKHSGRLFYWDGSDSAPELVAEEAEGVRKGQDELD